MIKIIFFSYLFLFYPFYPFCASFTYDHDVFHHFFHFLCCSLNQNCYFLMIPFIKLILKFYKFLLLLTSFKVTFDLFQPHGCFAGSILFLKWLPFENILVLNKRKSFICSDGVIKMQNSQSIRGLHIISDLADQIFVQKLQIILKHDFIQISQIFILCIFILLKNVLILDIAHFFVKFRIHLSWEGFINFGIVLEIFLKFLIISSGQKFIKFIQIKNVLSVYKRVDSGSIKN